MIELTDLAAESLHSALSDEEIEEGRAFRFTVLDDGGIGLDKGGRKSGDLTLEHAETPVLYVPEDLKPVLDNTRVEIEQTPEGQKLRVVRREPAG